MNKRLLTLSLLTLALMEGCAVAGDAPASHAKPLTLFSGTLVMKGSLPNVYPVLVSGDRMWALSGLSKEDARSLQNKAVTVEGVELYSPSAAPPLPNLRVTRIALNRQGN